MPLVLPVKREVWGKRGTRMRSTEVKARTQRINKGSKLRAMI
jgi:hypothetical protein